MTNNTTTMAPTERIEIRVYRGKQTPVLVLTKVFEVEAEAEGACPEASDFFRKYDMMVNPHFGRANPEIDGLAFDGVEYVVDVGGEHEDTTDFGGVCPFSRKCEAEDSGSWQREQAMEAGMLHGIDAYNDMMGN